MLRQEHRQRPAQHQQNGDEEDEGQGLHGEFAVEVVGPAGRRDGPAPGFEGQAGADRMALAHPALGHAPVGEHTDMEGVAPQRPQRQPRLSLALVPRQGARLDGRVDLAKHGVRRPDQRVGQPSPFRDQTAAQQVKRRDCRHEAADQADPGQPADLAAQRHHGSGGNRRTRPLLPAGCHSARKRRFFISNAQRPSCPPRPPCVLFNPAATFCPSGAARLRKTLPRGRAKPRRANGPRAQAVG